MDNRLESEVREVEREFITWKKMFTAMDIGNALKQKGINVRQRQVSPIVREHFHSKLYGNTGYTRTPIPVGDGGQEAFLYFHIDNSPTEYTGYDQEPIPWDPNKPMFSDEVQEVKSSDDSGSDDGKSVGSIDDLQQDSDSHSDNQGLDNLLASKHSKVYHSSTCMYAGRIRQENLVTFNDDASAVSASYRKCMAE